jgi:hypothetical protein
MGFFKNIHLEILECKARGRSIEDTYIYFKDYIELEDLVAVWEGNYDQEPTEVA